MTTTEETTRADVEAAERDAVAQDAALNALETNVARGDMTITAAAIEKQTVIARHAHRVAEGVRTLFTQSEVRRRDRALRGLAADIEAGQGKGATELVEAWDALEAAARAFQTLADEYDAEVRGWERRAMNLDLTAQPEHGLSEQGGVRFHGDHLGLAFASDRFANLFVVPGGYYAPLPLRTAEDDMLTATRAALKRLGGDDE